MRDNREMLERIAAFLSDYVRMASGDHIPPLEDVIIDVIFKLIDNGVFTPEEMKMEALRTCSVIIPDMFFEDVESWRG